jgi:murein DD-endopeptidase MepM/ murein hydrolase activator NlpD
MVAWQRPTELPIVAYGGADQGFETMRVTSPFGWRPNPLYPTHSSVKTVFHGGLDIGNHRAGDKVTAAADGEVIAEGALMQPWSIPAPAGSGWWGGNYGGLMAVIRHDADEVSIYAHLERTIISVGDRVAAGQHIGEVGDTGSAAGAAHLHFGIQLDGDDVDPWPLITAGPSRRDRLEERVRILRRRHPKPAARWVRNTGITSEAWRQPLHPVSALAAEVMFLDTYEES